MNKELIISSAGNSVKMALLENGRLAELHEQNLDKEYQVGDIYLGRVKRLMPGLNAAFIIIGHPKDAFLHYSDLSPKLQSVARFTKDCMRGQLKGQGLDNFTILPDIKKDGKINQIFSRKQNILVQVLKEPISTKGPRLTCEITIAGHNLILLPFTEAISISKKIASKDERERLKTLVDSIKPKNFGVIIRTAAEGKKVAELHEELEELKAKWESIKTKLKNADVPSKVLSEMDKTNSYLRDAASDEFSKILVDDEEVYGNIKAYFNQIAPGKQKILQLYSGKKPIFESAEIKRQIKASFGKTPTMPSGAYLVIEHTEAMHVIDVNSGPKKKALEQEEAALEVNLESAKEIARQLRLRDLGGLIIVDFIDMKKKEHKTLLLNTIREHMATDHAQHTVLPLSKFGLLQITRQRVKPAVQINTAEKCPACNGTGEVTPTFLITEEIERNLEYIIKSRSVKKIKLVVHPFIAAYFKKGLWNQEMKWRFKHGKRIKVAEDIDLAFNQYTFFDQMDDEIRM